MHIWLLKRGQHLFKHYELPALTFNQILEFSNQRPILRSKHEMYSYEDLQVNMGIGKPCRYTLLMSLRIKDRHKYIYILEQVRYRTYAR